MTKKQFFCIYSDMLGIFVFCIFLFLQLFAQFLEANTDTFFNMPYQKIRYELSHEPIDVVIPCGDRDIAILDLCVTAIKQNVKNYRRIIIVSSAKFSDQAEWFDETKYPFSKHDLALYIFDNDELADFYTFNPSRLGWIYQQFLKLYAPLVIPDISSNVLIVDADTIFLKPVEFIGTNGEGLYNPGTEYHAPYFEHAAKLIPGLFRVYSNYSGISNHMLFQREVIYDLFYLIEKHHNCDAWKAMCRSINQQHFSGAAMSEYEIYFNFVFSRTDQMQIRKLKWANISLNDLPIYQREDYDYVSCHYYLR